jgi:heme/copper-type cytochrome/quinol oxidase subunit 3
MKSLLAGHAEAMRQLDRAQQWVQREGEALDVSALPSFGFSHRSLMWWGTAGMIAIEGMVFALTVVSYFYLRSHAQTWPMRAAPPDLIWGTLNTVILIASLIPNEWAKKAAERLDLAQVRLALIACLAFGLAFLVVRVFEFGALNCRWDDTAYASVVWVIMGLHTAHLLTDVLDTAVLAVLMVQPAIEGRRFVDVSESAVYWYFVVLAWLPLYAVVYLSPRWA